VTLHTLVLHGPVYVVVAALLALVAAERFGRSGVCVQCGGRNAHRATCPFKDKL
jgi:hypothetical protein